MTRRPVPHWPSIGGRARADAGPLLLSAVVVALVALLASTVPALLRAAADDAVRDAVVRSHGYADVTATAPWPGDYTANGRIRSPRLAELLEAFRRQALTELGPLHEVLGPPVATTISPNLTVAAEGPQRTFRLAYLSDGDGPRVTWIAGTEPGPAFPTAAEDVEAGKDVPWLVRIGLSEQVATILGVRPGDRIPLIDEHGRPQPVEVSGIFRADEPGSPVWRTAPWLLNPVRSADGSSPMRLGGLLSASSLPDARLAFPPDELQRTAWFAPDPEALTWKSAQAVGRPLATLKARSAATGDADTSISWNTQFDAVLRDVRDQVDGATVQASVLLTGVLAGAIMVLLLAAELLVRRRAAALTVARQRGAALASLGAELLLESAVVAAVATAVGLALARATVPTLAWGWAVPVALAATAATPALGVRVAAHATRDRRVPANRSARQWAARTVALRRFAVEAAILAAAVAAFAAMRQRGGGATAGAALPASAPALGSIVGALVLLRLLPPATRLVLRRALATRGGLAVFGAARAAATAGRALPVLALVTPVALASFALTVHATVAGGLVDGAWQTVGADARLDVADDARASTARLAQQLAAAPGVRHVVAAQVTDHVHVTAGNVSSAPRLIIVDVPALRRLLADTPIPQQQALDRLTAPKSGTVPALVRSTDGTLRPGMTLTLFHGDNSHVTLTVVGTAPPIGDAGTVVLVDAAAMAAAGLQAVPDTIWVTGTDAEHVVTANAAAGNAVLRTDVLAARRHAPLAAGLLRLARFCAVALLALGLLGIALAAATEAPARWQTLTRLRTLGLRRRDVRRVAAGELLPLVVLTAVVGPALGVMLTRVTLGPLALRLLTGQTTDPVVTPPWIGLGLGAVALLAAVPVVIPVEWALRRHQRLGEVLRAGDG